MITASQIIEGSKFNLKMGEIIVTEIEIDGYSKGKTRVYTKFVNGDVKYANELNDLVNFINESL